MKNKYLWSYVSDTKAQFWSEGSQQCYFSYECKNQFVPDALINDFSKAKISLPQKVPYDIFQNHSILASGIFDAKKDYYHSRPAYPHHILLFVLAGTLSCIVDGKKSSHKRGTLICIPAGAILEESVRCERCKVLWVHIKQESLWNISFGKTVKFQESAFLADIISVAEIMRKEIYAKERSIFFLQNIIAVFAELIRREFNLDKLVLQNDKIAVLAKEIENAPECDWKNSNALKKLNLSQTKLDHAFEKRFSLSFAKFILKHRMEKSLRLLSEGKLSFTEIAHATGYADQSALSKAFKRYYGSSLKNHKRVSACLA